MNVTDTIVGISAGLAAIAAVGALIHRGAKKLSAAVIGPSPADLIAHWRKELGVDRAEQRAEQAEEKAERVQREVTVRFLKHMPWDERTRAALKRLGEDPGEPPPLLSTDGDLVAGWQEHNPPAPRYVADHSDHP